jgi:hypothetical protein
MIDSEPALAANFFSLKGISSRWLRRIQKAKDPSHGQFVDQTHLNLLPIYFDHVKILKHRGCNVANWKQVECRREKKTDQAKCPPFIPTVAEMTQSLFWLGSVWQCSTHGAIFETTG